MLHTLVINRKSGKERISISIDSAENINITGSALNGSMYVSAWHYKTTYSEWLDLSLDVHKAVDELRKEFGHE